MSGGADESESRSPELSIRSSELAQLKAKLDALLSDPRTLVRLFRVAFAIMGNEADAEDVVQRAIVRAYLRLAQLRDRDDPLGWLLQIVRSIALDLLREQKRRGRAGLPENDLITDDRAVDGLTVALDAERDEDEARRGAAVAAAVSRLSPSDRELLRLRFGAELPYKQIAELLGITETSARMRMHRLLGRLREALGAKEACS